MSDCSRHGHKWIVRGAFYVCHYCGKLGWRYRGEDEA